MQGIKACLIYIDHLISLIDHLLNNEDLRFGFQFSMLGFREDDEKLFFGNYVSF